MDQFKAMRIFRTVAECSSFAKAAEQLDLPRPTVTNAVQSVEKQVGARLLQRTTRKVSLTLEGTLYLERCNRLLNDLEEMNALFVGPDHAPSGVIRVDLPERMANQQVIPRLPEFFRLYPGIQVRVGANDRFVDLVGEGIDCAIRVGALRDSGLIARRLGMMEQINCASAAYVAEHGMPSSLADLANHEAVSFFSSQTGRDLAWEYHVDGKDHTLAMRSRMSVSSTEAYFASCRAGLGLIQAPRMSMRPWLDSGELVEVLPEWRPRAMPVSAVYPHNRHLSARVRVFIDWVARMLKELT